MTHKKNERQFMKLPVTEDLTVTVIPSSDHEFLMTSTEVADGYGLSSTTIRRQLQNHKGELAEGKHFVKGVQIMNTLAGKVQPHQIFWTKRGIVRLGFFIKSERAKLFRDWAEDLVIKLSEAKQPLKALPAKRKHNRLTPERLADILADVCLIEDKGVRVSLTNKLTGRA